MHIWSDLVTRELLLLVLLAAFGSGPASYLGEDFDWAARLAMAPVLGMCVGVGAFTTLLWFVPASQTSWCVVPVAVASMAVAFVRRDRWRRVPTEDGVRGAPQRPWRFSRMIDITQLAVMCLAVAVPITYTLHQHSSVGPVSYAVGDVDGYVSDADAAQHLSLRTAAAHANGPFADLTVAYWDRYAGKSQQLDVTPLLANVDNLAGLGATETDSSFLVVFLVVGALGAFAAVRATVRRPTWAAVIAGGLFGGAFFLQLFFDGSEGAICGLAVLLPLAVVGHGALERRWPGDAVLFALLLSGLIALYPLFVAPVGVAIAVALGAAVLRRGRVRRRSLGALGRGVVTVAILVVLFDVVAFVRFLGYWQGLLRGGYVKPDFPRFTLGAGLVPGWLFQTRELYNLAFTGHSVASNAIFAVAAPMALAGVAIVALWRYPLARLLLPLVATSGAIALYERVHNNCSYCEDRNLLPVAPVLILLVGLGIAAVAGSRLRRHHWLALGLAALTVASAGYALGTERQRFSNDSYFLDSSARALVSRIPSGGGPIELEGFNEGPHALVEQFLIYALADERSWGNVSLSADHNDNNALSAYAGTYPLPGPMFRPYYRYVLTRIPAVATPRPTVARIEGIALERRTRPLDVFLDYGLLASASASTVSSGGAQLNPTGNGTVQFVVAGGPSPGSTSEVRSERQSAFVALRVALPAGAPSPVITGNSTSVQRRGDTLDVCVRTTGSAPVRLARLHVRRGSGAQLTAVAVAPRRCPTLDNLPTQASAQAAIPRGNRPPAVS
jgi:hypothetical protein